MLLKMDKLDETTYTLKASFEGEKYDKALANYPTYVQEIFRDLYENELFPEGGTPIVVNEELHGDGLYREIIKAHFICLYQEVIKESRISNAHLEKVVFDCFSREKIVFTLTVSSLPSASHDNELKHITDTLDSELAHISNVDKLVINTKTKRDEYFWKDLQGVCVAYQQTMSQKLAPILSKLGVLNYGGDAIEIDINDSNPMRSLYPVIEIALFPCAVLAAALHEYIQDFTSEDERNLKKYIFSTANELLGISEQLGSSIKSVLTDRLNEYTLACENELLSGLSLYEVGMDFEGLEGWSQSHEVKCAHILCDHIAYIKYFRELGTYEDLDKLRPIVVNNSEQTVKDFMELFRELYPVSGAIFMTVRGALNGSRKIKWKAAGLCQHCGRVFKKGLFGLKCPACKIKKDY